MLLLLMLMLPHVLGEAGAEPRDHLMLCAQPRRVPPEEPVVPAEPGIGIVIALH